MSDRMQISSGVVHPWHHDVFGHMNVRHYAHFFDDGAFHFWTCLGLSYDKMQREHGVHTVTASSKITFVKELTAGDLFYIDAAVTRLGGKSVTYEMRMVHRETQQLHATYESVEVFFDPQTRGSTAMPQAIRDRLAEILSDESD